MTNRIFKAIGLVLLVALFPLSASAQKMNAAVTDSVRILFIGNSYTYFNELPQMVKKIAATQNIPIAIGQVTPGGYYFRQHIKNPKVFEEVKKGNWSYVVLQEQSQAPSYSSWEVQSQTFAPAHSLDSLIHQYNPSAKVIFYMTWGHRDGDEDSLQVKKYPLTASYLGMQMRLMTSYLEMAYQNDAWCAPVGIAWMKAREQRPKFNLYMPDGSHPTVGGSYLAANVIFTTIFQHRYKTTFTAGLADDDAQYFRQLAEETVLTNLRLINIEKAK